MNTDRIDFISSYCDRWCERCAFTSRCSLFATEAAIAMCGDVQEGFELAVGAPYPEPGHAELDLISIKRSEAAWRVVAQAAGDETPGLLASELRRLGRDDNRAFKDAWSFIRPGFDEPWR